MSASFSPSGNFDVVSIKIYIYSSLFFLYVYRKKLVSLPGPTAQWLPVQIFTAGLSRLLPSPGTFVGQFCFVEVAAGLGMKK